MDTYNNETLPGLIVKATEYCTETAAALDYDEEVGKWYGSARRGSNATIDLSAIYGNTIEEMYAIMFGDNFTIEECDEADCLHPCYGASHERYCNQCWGVSYMKIKNKEDFIFTEDEMKVCRSCKIPSPEAEPMPMMTYDEYIEFLKAKNAENEAEA